MSFSFTRTWAFRLGQPPGRVTEICPPAGLRDVGFVSGQGHKRWHLFTSNTSTSRPEPWVNPLGHLETPVTAMVLARSSKRRRGEAKNVLTALPTHSRDPRLVMTSRAETPAALVAVADHVRRLCFGLLAKGESLARLHSRESFQFGGAFLPLIVVLGEGESCLSAASRAAEALSGAA